MDLLEAIGVMPGDLGDFRGRLDMRIGLGSSWCLILYRLRPVDPTTWDILGRVPLKNQVLPPDTGKGVLKESSPAKTLFFLSWCFDSLEAQGVSTL